MATYNQSQLTSASNATYFDNSTGSITPTAVRSLNTNWISSSVLLSMTSSMSVATASFVVSASYASTASLLLGTVVSASSAISASYAVSASQAATASYYGGSIVSASYALSSSFAQTASLALTISSSITTQNLQHNVLFVDTSGPGLVQVDGGLRYNPNTDILTTTASLAQTASYVVNAISASRATSAANADTASYVLNAVSASRATSALNADTASYVLQAVSSSLATTNLYTASVSNNVVTFTKGDATTFNLTVATGSGTNIISASYALSASQAANATLFNSLSSSQFAQLVANNTYTGNNVFGNVTASNALITSASVLNLTVIYETASVIFSSGSNQFGDASNDIQTLWGQVDIKSGPVTVTGSLNVSGGITGSLLGTSSYATNAGTAATASYVVTAQTASYVANAVSASRATSAANADTASYVVTAQTASYVLNATSASFATTANSVNTLVQAVVISGSLTVTGSSVIIGTKTISGSVFITGSKTITGTNTVVGINTVTGSFFVSGSTTFTGSFNGLVVSQSIASNTSSLDFGTANFFTSLVSGSTFFNVTNPKAGETVNVLLTTSGVATASFSTNVKQVSGSAYTPTSGSGKNDVITFISFDGTSVYLANVKNLI